MKHVSIVIPAKNENRSIGKLVEYLIKSYPDFEVLVVNDGSEDNTALEAEKYGAKVINHPYSKGNGAAIKTGARNAKGSVLVFMDADGQHKPEDVERLLKKLDDGYDMVVGARKGDSQASVLRGVANRLYNKLASLMTGCQIEDLTSGFRAAKAIYFKRFLYLLPNGFSYPTTSTMAFFRSGLSVGYIPILAQKRQGKSHIRLLKDGAKFLVIIFKIGALFSPMRFFLPISAALFSVGLVYYGYTYSVSGRFTNMSALLFISSLLTFLIGVLSEQVSALHYKGLGKIGKKSVVEAYI
ncbi:MAG: glycosyltransferase family 2 protein [Pseudomonadales bacterium]